MLPGIDLVYYGNQQQLEYDLVVNPHADPAAIHFEFEGAESLAVTDAGELLIHTSSGDLVQHAPVMYQEIAEGKQPAVPAINPRRRRQRVLEQPQDRPAPFRPEQRLLILDAWQRSGLPATEFADLVAVTPHTLYAWKRAFDEQGPAGLMDRPRGGPRGSRLPDLTKRTILLLKQAHPEWGCQRISDMLLRGPALPASPTAVARVLHEAGYELDQIPARPRAEPAVRRARPAAAAQDR